MFKISFVRGLGFWKVKIMNLGGGKISTVAVVGLGYVGLPLAIEFGKYRNVVGFDTNSERISELKIAKDVTEEVSEIDFIESKYLRFTTEISDIKNCNFFIITVPTPVDKYKKPDLSPLFKATKMVGSVLKKGDIVIYESTVFPGCTEEECSPLLESTSGLKFNVDFFCGYSPERVNPGDKTHRLKNIKKQLN